MFNPEFFPTPPEIAYRMVACLKIGSSNDRKTILEPSAGKGDILNQIESIYKDKHKVYVFENDMQLEAILKTKNCIFLGNDFLAYNGSQHFDYAILNPPFSNGDAHALKAFDVLESGGEMVCLLNAETIKNPYTKTRQMLAELVERHGTIEELGKCFAKAERKTSAEIVMIHIKKPITKTRFDFDDAGFTNSNREFDLGEDFSTGSLATKDTIANMVHDYNNVVDAMLDMKRAMSKMLYFLNVFGVSGKETSGVSKVPKIVDALFNVYETPNTSFNNAIDLLKGYAWRKLQSLTKVGNEFTNEAKKQFVAYITAQEGCDFSHDNIMKLLEYLVYNREFLMQLAIEQTFDMMCSYHYENRVSPESWNKTNKEGWKTNSHYKVNPKVVIPDMVEQPYGYWTVKWANREKLDEIDKVLCYIMSMPNSQIVTISEGLEHTFKKTKISESNGSELFQARLKFEPKAPETGLKMIGDEEGNKESAGWKVTKPNRANGNLSESTFFYMEFFKKGTLHLHFKHRIVWETFNIIANKNRKQLG